MQHRVQPITRPPAPPPIPLQGLEPERLRVALEGDTLAHLWQAPSFRALTGRLTGELDPAAVRRRLLAHALRLSPSMAPDLFRVARQTASLLGVSVPLELYQAAGEENARMHLVRDPALLEVQGRLLALVDDDALRALLGHELGHYLAHGDADGHGARRVAARVALSADSTPDEIRAGARLHSLACEFTADRFGLLACQDLHAALRLSMICTTGLSGDTLAWDTEAYRAQCVELCEQLLADGAAAEGVTHPEHSVRGYALWLFSECDLYQALTGKGSGARPIAEVDALLARLVGSSPPEGDAAVSLFEVPLAEMHEFALASAVIVAWADGAVDDSEADALEGVFATLVDDWRALLDLDAAHARFAQTLPVMRTADAQQHMALFQLLAHVMAADGVVAGGELETILGIGQALGQLPLFERLLEATLEALGIQLELEEVPPAPLRTSRGEAQDALACFLDNLRRRGRAQATVRRLLRLVGEAADRPEARARIAAAFSAAEVTATPSVESAPLDRTLSLSTPPLAKPVREAPALEGARQELLKALVRLREKLVSGDGRSPSVRLRQTRRGRVFDLFSLEQVKTGQAERALLALRAGRQADLVRAAEAGVHGPALRCVEQLTALDRMARDQQEETGAHDLYLGYPVVRGVIGQGAAAYLVRGPLVLHPVDLVRDARGARGYRVAPRRDEDPVINLALLRTAFNKLGYALTDHLIDDLNGLAADPGAGTAAVLGRLAEVGVDVVHPKAELGPFKPVTTQDDAHEGPLRVEECALLGLFPQSSSDLLQDYDALLKALQAGTPLDTVLAAGRAVLPAALQAELPDLPPPNTPDDAKARPAVVKADPSQREAVSRARLQQALVVDGPPGTGKSQVIVNLVADALARGERVAVVCEKRAALDVVCQRLEGLGLRDALAVVHDLNDDRKPLFAQIVDRFTAPPGPGFDAEEAAEFAATADRYRAELAARDADLARRLSPDGLTYGQLLLLAQGTPAPDLPDAPRASLGRLRPSERAGLERQALRLQALEPLWRLDGRWRGPAGARWQALGDEAALDLAAQALARATQAARARDERASDTPVSPGTVRDLGSTLGEVRTVIQGVGGLDRGLLSACLGRLVAEGADGLSPVARAQAALTDAGPALTEAAAPVTQPAELPQVAEALRRWHGRFWRFFSPGWWKARAALRAVASTLWPPLAGHPPALPLLETVEARLQAVDAWAEARAQVREAGLGELPDDPQPAQSQLERLGRVVQQAASLFAHRPALKAAGLWAPPPLGGGDAGWAEWLDRLTAAQALQAADQAAREAMAPVIRHFPWLPPDSPPEALAALADALADDGPRLLEADELLRGGPEGLPLLPLVDALAAAAPQAAPARWTAALTRGWAQARAAALEAAHPALKSRGLAADARRAAERAAELGTLQDSLAEIEVERIRHQLSQAPLLAEPAREKFARKTPKQATREAMLKEASKKRRLMTLRGFVRRFVPEGLLDVLPVWLLSPETIAVLFEREPVFDLVVFDEASQCTVEAGFPVLLRAKRVVVAGDEHQMPPTAFFKQDDDDPEDLDEGERAVRDVFAAESLLTLARGRCAHTRLSWHYRCLHESLIAFSNHAIYEGDLQTIPATDTPQAAKALRWIAVPDGEYDAGANAPEARRVVALLHDLLAEDPERTLGVVTFNLKQRRAVLDEIDARRQRDDAFEALWAEAEAREPDARPFVKNLESVQGDERDVIVFSLGHAPRARIRGGQPTDEYYVPARFGPLGQRGGERRLNVAVSRAKRACYVVASFAPEQLSVSNATHRGPLLFKRFIEFAHCMDQGRLAEADRVLDHVRAGPRRATSQADGPLPAECTLAAQVALALEAEGVPVARDVGTSGFTVPVAVYNPADPGRYKLALLLDDGSAPLDPFEAHVHRPAVLGLRGWAVRRITAADWARRPGEIVGQILDAVPGAQGALSRPPWAQRAEAPGVPAAPTPAAPEAPTAAPAAWHVDVAAKLRPLLAVLERDGALSRDQAARLLNGRAFDRLRFQLDALRSQGKLPWDFTLDGQGPQATLRVIGSPRS